MLSNVSTWGFPNIFGVTPVESDMAAQKEPTSGINPFSTGQLISGWVA